MATRYPIEHWSYSSLIAYLRNPLAWYKRYVEKVYDVPSSPAGIVGRTAHKALEHFYSGIEKEGAIDLGLEYLQGVPDFDIDFGKARSRTAQKKKRLLMEREYTQAIHFYLEKPPRHSVLKVEHMGMAKVEGIPIPIKAISDLVVKSKIEPGAVDIVDHKFVASFSGEGKDKPLFVLQALFNYYTVAASLEVPVRRFMVYECKKRKNKDGKKQIRRYSIDFNEYKEEFTFFHKLLREATEDARTRKVFLPNPSDMFEGENSFDIYRLGL
ncbi:MAG: PD-(D/E)XK nuclease family protein [Candidatus Paceibacterota bacterium]